MTEIRQRGDPEVKRAPLRWSSSRDHGMGAEP